MFCTLNKKWSLVDFIEICIITLILFSGTNNQLSPAVLSHQTTVHISLPFQSIVHILYLLYIYLDHNSDSYRSFQLEGDSEK